MDRSSNGEMMTTAETSGSATMQQVADELEIRNVVARLAHLADNSGPDDLDEYVSLYTDDAVWGVSGNEIRGSAAIREAARERRLAGQQGPGTNSRHIITTVAVRVDGADDAVCDACLLFLRDTSSSPAIALVARYHDVLRRHDGRWKVARREITPG
jgi:uncharacterized protein (TIGR02246 family)